MCLLSVGWHTLFLSPISYLTLFFCLLFLFSLPHPPLPHPQIYSILLRKIKQTTSHSFLQLGMGSGEMIDMGMSKVTKFGLQGHLKPPHPYEIKRIHVASLCSVLFIASAILILSYHSDIN